MSTEGEALEKAVPQETWFDAGQVLEAAYNNGYPLTGEIDADGNVVGEGLFGCDSDGHDCSLRALLYSGGYIPGTRARIATIGHPSTSLILDGEHLLGLRIWSRWKEKMDKTKWGVINKKVLTLCRQEIEKLNIILAKRVKAVIDHFEKQDEEPPVIISDEEDAEIIRVLKLDDYERYKIWIQGILGKSRWADLSPQLRKELVHRFNEPSFMEGSFPVRGRTRNVFCANTGDQICSTDIHLNGKLKVGQVEWVAARADELLAGTEQGVILPGLILRPHKDTLTLLALAHFIRKHHLKIPYSEKACLSCSKAEFSVDRDS